MDTQGSRSQNSPRSSTSRDISLNCENDKRHPDDRWEDVEVRHSVSPARNASQRRNRRARTEFIASQPGSARGQHWRVSQCVRGRWNPGHPGNSADVREIVSPPPPPVDTVIQQQITTEIVKEYVVSIFGYIVMVVASSFNFIRWFLSLALGIVILWLLFKIMISPLVFLAQPFCSIPVVSPMIPFCHWEAFQGTPAYTSAGRPVRWADYSTLVDLQTRTFDQLLDESIGNRGLALEVKKAEMASNDLITLVRASNLKSKDQIAERLSRFVDDARGTGRSLHSLGSRILGAVELITCSNEYALQTIEASKAPPSLTARLLSFALSTANPTKETVLGTFLVSMDNVAHQIARLREEAEISMGHLLQLEEHLMILYEVTHRNNEELTAAQEDVLAELWTWLGGNKHRLRKIDNNLDLLKNVERYRRKALAHVVATLHALQTLDADMEELRTRVAAPDIVGDKIPVEVHMKSIKAGVERLKERRLRASSKQGGGILEIDA